MPERDHTSAGTAPVLNIGDGFGAVLVTFTELPSEGELRACPRGEPHRHFHTGVHVDSEGATSTGVALFPEVPAGEYSLLSPDGAEHTPFTVTGGEVTRLQVEG